MHKPATKQGKLPKLAKYVPKIIIKEPMIKSGAHIAQSDFSSDCIKTTQEYLMYFKEFWCKMTENMQARCVPSHRRDLISGSLILITICSMDKDGE